MATSKNPGGTKRTVANTRAAGANKKPMASSKAAPKAKSARGK